MFVNWKPIFLVPVFLSLVFLSIVWTLSKSSWGQVEYVDKPLSGSQVSKLAPLIVPDTIEVGWSEATSLTLSASLKNGDTRLFVVALSISVLAYTLVKSYSRKENLVKRLIDFFLRSAATLMPVFVVAARVDDLDDEAYVWASKIDQFILNGVLGVPILGGKYGESTVGTLHFVLAAAVRWIFDSSVEQSLIWIILAIGAFSGLVLFEALRVRGASPQIALVATLFVLGSPSLTLTASRGFDNALILYLLVIWLSVEATWPEDRKLQVRVATAIIAPLIRLEFALLSILIFAMDLSLLNVSRSNFLGKVRLGLRRWWPAFAIAVLWIAYKYLVFGEILPAMAKYKSPWFDLGAFEAGSTYFTKSIGEPFLAALVGLSAILFLRSAVDGRFAYRFVSWIGSNRVSIVPVALSVLLGIFTAIAGGGDYFGPEMARYVFPYLCAGLLILLLFAPWPSEPKNWFKPSLVSILALTITLAMNTPSRIENVLSDVSRIETSRVSCDRLGFLAVSKLREKEGWPEVRVLASPEVNGAAYFFEAELVDMIGLVDAHATKELMPQKPGSLFDKYQVELSPDQISSTDLIWLWPSSSCGLSEVEAEESLSNSDALVKNFLSNPDARYRFPQVMATIDSGLRPIFAQFVYVDGSERLYGNLIYLARVS